MDDKNIDFITYEIHYPIDEYCITIETQVLTQLLNLNHNCF